jgi:hypothetical protein
MIGIYGPTRPTIWAYDRLVIGQLDYGTGTTVKEDIRVWAHGEWIRTHYDSHIRHTAKDPDWKAGNRTKLVSNQFRANKG